MKKALLFLFIFQQAFAQNPQRREFTEGNPNQLILFENSLPVKKYIYTTSDLQVQWHVLILDLIEQTSGYNPIPTARSMAYINLAAYESILPAYSKLNSLSGQIQGYQRPKEFAIDSTHFIAQVAMNHAIYEMVNNLFYATPYNWMEKILTLRESIDAKYSNNKFGYIKSKNYGKSVAELIFNYSKSDGGELCMYRNYNIDYKLPECEGCFEINRAADLENTGPMYPNWGNTRTFFAENQKEINIKPSFEFSKYKGSKFYNEALEVYETSKLAKPGTEKHTIANFWDDAANYTYTAVGHSVSILTQVLRNQPESIQNGAKLYAQLTLALNDAMICTWRLKYKYNLIRPIAFIKRYIDSKWEPNLLTPPFPEFPSGHSAQSATMATVLSAKLGDKVAYTDYSKYWVGEPRKFKSFWESANETSISRLYGGIHFREGLNKGQELGKWVGKNALNLKFEK